MTEGEALALYLYGRSNPKTEIYDFEKVECPVCGKLVGGRSGFMGEHGRFEGVHQHMKFKHGMKRLKDRAQALEDRK